MKLLAYKNGSKSARALANALDIKLLKKHGKPVTDTVINWGCSKAERILEGEVINSPVAVALAVDKLKTFQILQGRVPLPKWTTELVEASRWLAEGVSVVARTKLNGHSGQGIIILDPNKPVMIPKAPLYTTYIKKVQEYRLHVCNDEVFFIQRKARALHVPKEGVNWQIRNHANGFIYAHKDVEIDPAAYNIAIMAVRSLGLHFGAVDLIMDFDGDFFVLEVNTACGLEGTTLEKYVEQFKRFL